MLITVDPLVNQPPSFVKGPDVAVLENAGHQILAGWAGEISAGSPDETGQSLNFEVSADAPSLFTELPAVSADGTLTFTTGPDCYGSTRVTVVLKDDGGIQHGGQDTSAAQTFLIIVRPTLYPPRLTVEVSFDTRLTFTWPAVWGYTYCVRYKDALDDPEWRGLPAQVVTEGNLCRFTADLADATAHRFYRVEASP